MTKSFKRVKACVIMSIFLVSIFAAFTTSSSAKILKVKPIITIKETSQDRNVIPKSGSLNISLEVTFTLTGWLSGFVEDSPFSFLKNSAIAVDLSVTEDCPWITATIDNEQAEFKIGETKAFDAALIRLTVTEMAPAFDLGTVTVTAVSQELSGVGVMIEGITKSIDVSFEIGYWPAIEYSEPDGNLKQCGPLDTIDFPIAVENIGNGLTQILIEVVEKPGEDWSVTAPSSIWVASSAVQGQSNTNTIHVKVKPPYGFGFHNDRGDIKIKVTPQYPGQAGQPGLVGASEVKTFTVQSVGFSPGTGFEIPLIVTILVVLFIGIYIFNKWRKK